MTDDLVLAERFISSASAATEASVSAEPEAQLTGPIKELFEALELSDKSRLTLVREAQLDGVRPDFAALVSGRPCGWIELKAPSKSVDTSKWRGRDAQQWTLLRELDAIIVSNGRHVQLYLDGVESGDPVPLPGQGNDWTSEPLKQVLLRFASSRPATVKRVSQLALKLAPLTRMLRDKILKLLEAPGDTPIRRGLASWSSYVHNNVSEGVFANDLSQVISYSLAIAALRGGADYNFDDHISIREARQAIESSSPVLSAALGPVLGVNGLADSIAHEVAAIERLASVVDTVAISKSKDPRGEPWLWFYEDFLHAFDPVARKRAGVYYTPTDIVEAQVRLTEHILRDYFGRSLGFADKSVITLDPACGSGTYPLAVIDAAVASAEAERGPAGPAQIVPTLARNLISFELMPGPYAVAHLRIGQRLAEGAGQLIPPEVRVYLTDTLENPNEVPQALALWGDVEALAEERRRAQLVKREQEVVVAIGNPPYERVSQHSNAGGWVISSGKGRSLFDDILEPATSTTIFSAIASLYNLYVYFWRWTIWKTFEASGDGPAVVSFITASSWLNGAGFVGLRQLAQQLGDEIWVCDLGGDNRGNNSEENVFDIETPVAIVTIFRLGVTDRATPARIYYKRVRGTRAEKLQTVRELASPSQKVADWTEVPVVKIGDKMSPGASDASWQALPPITDIFPWQAPGMMINRKWPTAPDQAVLEERWNAFVSLPTADARAEAYVTPTTGRNIHTKVRGLPALSSLTSDAAHRPIVKYSARSFDRQWIFNDPRLIALERPALWSSLSEDQIFLSTMTTSPLGPGPAMTAACYVPDKHHFRGSYGGKDVIPLYRDSSTAHPNLTKGLLSSIGERLRESDERATNPQAIDLASYVYGLLASPAYYERFKDSLAQTPHTPRVPITRNADTFARVRDLGRELLWLHTYAQRCNSKNRPSTLGRDADVSWVKAVTKLPESTREIRFDLESGSSQSGV